ncbi:MAG: MHYT domain-containing protein [Alphaproteobacteria bacterium]
MVRVYACITQQHDPWLVVLAALLCLFAAFAALSITNRAHSYDGVVRAAWLVAGAFISATGIWATHFVAMLAFETGLPTGFDIKLTVFSLIAAIVITGLGLALPVYLRHGMAPQAGGVVFGIGISTMHFVGMQGLLVPAVMTWDPLLVAAAWLLGCSFAVAAIRLAHGKHAIRARIGGALLLTLAICSMHFTGMAALELTPSPLMPMPTAYLTSARLGFDIGLAALVIMTVGACGALVDQHLAGRRAREAERLRSLVNATFEGIGICVEGRLVEVNDALSDLLKVPVHSLQGRPIDEFVDRERRDTLGQALTDGGDRTFELPLLPASGSPIFAELLVKSINYGKRPAKVVAVRDITERQAARAKLEQYRDHLEQLVAERTTELQDQAERLADALDEERKLAGLQRQFVSMVSHEFRTPLAIIDGHAQRLLRRSTAATPDRSIEALRKIRTSVTRLTDLMESVLAAARLEDGRIEFRPADCELLEMIAELARNYGELHPNHKILVDVDQAAEHIVADAKLLRQVFSNLLSNAIKYSPDGGNVWVDGRAQEDGGIVIAVRDQGVGIPVAEQQKLFSRFFRASTSTGIAGTGIGLHLAFHLVQLHGGTIDVESAEGAGTTFHVHLPNRGSSADPAEGGGLPISAGEGSAARSAPHENAA